MIQQIPLRRDRQQASGKKKVEDDDLDDLDTQQAGEEAKEPEDQGQDDLDTIKGGGKGGFAGNCNYCGKYGHRKSECWTLTQALGKGKGAEGKGKGKDSGNNFGGKWDLPVVFSPEMRTDGNTKGKAREKKGTAKEEVEKDLVKDCTITSMGT